MASVRTTLEGPARTFTLGMALGRLLQGNDVVGLSGNLGAGKTLLVRGVAHGLGVPLEDVQSPTYTIIQSYRGRKIPVHHVDLYRLAGEAELYGTGYFELLGTGAVMLVEWVERIPGAAPGDWLHLVLDGEGTDRRVVTLTAHGNRARALASALAPRTMVWGHAACEVCGVALPSGPRPVCAVCGHRPGEGDVEAELGAFLRTGQARSGEQVRAPVALELGHAWTVVASPPPAG